MSEAQRCEAAWVHVCVCAARGGGREEKDGALNARLRSLDLIVGVGKPLEGLEQRRWFRSFILERSL